MGIANNNQPAQKNQFMKATFFFALTIQQGKGKFKIRTSASSEEAAAQKVMKAESCPRSAIVKIEQCPSPQQKKPIKTVLGFYRLAAITADHLFYVNYQESDDCTAVIMKDHHGKLISNNWHASNYLFELMHDTPHLFLWKSRYFAKELKLQAEANQ